MVVTVASRALVTRIDARSAAVGGVTRTNGWKLVETSTTPPRPISQQIADVGAAPLVDGAGGSMGTADQVAPLIGRSLDRS